MRDNSGSSSESSDSVAIIGGAVGGVILLLMIIAVLCIVILCMRRSCRKESLGAIPVDGKLSNNMIKLTNPICDVTIANAINKINSSIKLEKCNNEFNRDQNSDLDETIKKPNDPSYAGNIKIDNDLTCM